LVLPALLHRLFARKQALGAAAADIRVVRLLGALHPADVPDGPYGVPLVSSPVGSRRRREALGARNVFAPVVALTGPRCEEQKESRTRTAGHGAPLVGPEGEE